MQGVSGKKHWFGFNSFYVLLMLLILASGCVPTGGPKFREEMRPNDGTSTVYIYRVKKFIGADTFPDILDNGQKIMSNFSVGTYRVYHIKPGTHNFEPKQFGLFKKDSTTIVNDRPGQTYYIQLTVNIGYIGLNKMEPAAALPEIRDCILIEEGKGSAAQTTQTTPPVPPAQPTKSIQPATSQHPSATVEKSGSTHEPAVTYSFLSVKSTPPQSKIRILNIVPKFKQGIKLTPGRYHIETSAPGYVTDKRWVSVAPGAQTVSIQLSPTVQPSQKCESTH